MAQVMYPRESERNERKEGKKMRKIKDGILAEGEVTGHAHRVDADVYETEERTRVFKTEGTSVKHEEHMGIELAPNEYESDRVIEFDHFAEEARVVID